MAKRINKKQGPCKHKDAEQITGTTAAWCGECGALSLSAEERWRRPKATDGRSLRHRGNSTSKRKAVKGKAKAARKAKAAPERKQRKQRKAAPAAAIRAPKKVRTLRRRKGGANGEVVTLHPDAAAAAN